MKKIFFLLLTTFVCFTFVKAQVSARTTALNYLQYGELDNAKETIDKCVVHPKTAKDPRAWWYYGQIYQNIYASKDAKYKALDNDALTKSYDGYQKAMLYNFKDETFHTLDLNNLEDFMKFAKALNSIDTKYIDQEIVMGIFTESFPPLANAFAFEGIELYNNSKDYAKSLDHFEHAIFLFTLSGKVDTMLFFSASLAALQAKDYPKAKEYFNQLIEFKYGENDTERAKMYQRLADVYLAEGDTVNFNKTIDKGIKKYPGESLLMVQKINWFIDRGKVLEAENIIKKAIETDPKNKLLHYNLGIILSDRGSIDSAIIAYQKAIEVDPEYFDALYNLGALFYNQAVEINDACNDIPPSKQKEYDACKEKAKAKFNEALPHMEKAFELNPKDPSTLQSLKTIYYKIGDTDNYEKIDKLIKGE
ncbi:MAG: tetratricopeptide repeat protein [Bacteroidota bacterium]